MNYLPPSEGFLGLPQNPCGSFPATVIPFAMESTVSWRSGTANGPAAILEASHQVELFDETRMSEPVEEFKLRTGSVIQPAADAATALDQLAEVVAAELREGYFPLTLGGEHSITAGAIRPFAETNDEIVIVQLDAHADLRDGYEGEHFSHAAAMCRCLDCPNVSLVAFGIRNISSEEIPFLRDNESRIDIFWAHEKRHWDLSQLQKILNGRPVYLTVDLDGFDSSLMPATGTPEPGGLFWDDAIDIIQTVAKYSPIVGADIVELAPSQELHACDFLAAKLGYRILTTARESQMSRT